MLYILVSFTMTCEMLQLSLPCVHCFITVDEFLTAAHDLLYWHSSMLRAVSVHSQLHIDMGASLSTCIWLSVNTSLHVFQWWPFTLIQVLYEYRLPEKSLLQAVSVWVVFMFNSYEANTKFVLQVTSDAYMTSEIMSLFDRSLMRCMVSKFNNSVVECCCFIRKAFIRFDFTGDCQ